MRKVVVLNSGGFDSIVLMNDLRSCLEVDSEIHSLHFLYFSKNEKQQLKCVRKVCEKVNAIHKVICLPRFDWTKNEFYKGGENMYLEGRNLVFLSYAISYAESIGAEKIYLATLKSYGYTDTSVEFLDTLNKLSNLYGIEIVAPYSDCYKSNLFYLATIYDIQKDDFFSCDKPVNKKPCGECEDCKIINGFYANDIPVKAFIRHGRNILDPEFKVLMMNSPINEMRVLTNNLCQLKCKHCFYGFDEMKSEAISKDEMKRVIKEGAELGIKNFHFSGKEPLFNADIFEYAEYIRDNFPSCTYDVVTNGINIKKYIRELKSYGFKKVFLSFDDFSEESIRTYGSLDNVKLLNEYDIDTEIFIDLHKGNYDKLAYAFDLLKEYNCVHNFYVRTIKSIGNASDFELLSAEDLNSVYEQIVKLAEDNPNINFHLNINSEYADLVRDSDTLLSEMLFALENGFSMNVYSNFDIYAEIYCARYEKDITVTPDGYILGCATEVSNKDYDKLSAGNVKDKSLKELIQIGREGSLELQNKVCYECGEYCLKKCPHTLI